MLLIDDLLALPFKGFLGIFRKIYEMADRELNDQAYIQEKLLGLQLSYELGEIGEEEYARQAASLEARLNALRGAGEDEEEPAQEDSGEPTADEAHPNWENPRAA